MSAYKIIKSASLAELKENIEVNLSLYSSDKNKEIIDLLNTDEAEPDNTLIVTDLNQKSKDDLPNAIRLYEKFSNLPLSLASDEKFWAFLTHTSFWGYMRQRWPIEEAEGNSIEFIKTRYFFNTKNKTFYRNGLSRLWWYAYLTYDSTKEDPYYYTRLMLSNQEIANLLIETTNLARNQVALKAILEIIIKIDELEQNSNINRIKNKREFIRGLIKYVNLIGGVTVWDILSESEAYEKAWKYVEKHTKLVFPAPI
ncbi:DUF6339 family protein [Sporosarcina globispora]|uniref:DUF6339 family protein n=1 Tax=Sporosarcina globispora TaxID=1459 RepID=UPI0006A986CA|nr:DUF6339 family protein [Sporosarcina globispora]